MDRIQWQRLGETFKRFLFSRRSREVLVFSFFLAVSAGFWLMQTLNDTYDMDVQVPLELSGVPRDVIITDQIPSPIRVTVRDKGVNLIRYYRMGGKAPMQVPFVVHAKGGSLGHVVVTSDVQKQLSTYLLGSSKVMAVHPDTIDYYFTRGMYKRVPVRLQGRIESNPLYYISDTRIVPDSVTVWAPSSVLDTLRAAPTQACDVTDLTHNDSRRIRMANLKGVKFEPDEVQVVSLVDMFTEKSVTVPITGLNFPGDKSLITFPSTATITFRIGTKQFKKITADDFVVAITYEELLQTPGTSFRLHVRSVPEGVSQVRISPATVDYLLEQTNE